MEELIPSYSRVNRSHLAIELEVTALCGLINDVNNFSSSWRRGAIRPKYTQRVLTGHTVLFVGKEERLYEFPLV